MSGAELGGQPPGQTFADALARTDFELLGRGCEPSDHLERLVSMSTPHDAVGNPRRAGCRLEGENPDGRFVVEQPAHSTERDASIGPMRVVCSGLRPPQG